MKASASVSLAVVLITRTIAAATGIQRTRYDKIDAIAMLPLPEDSVYRIYQPRLVIDAGCVPYPAVGSNGEVSAGLMPNGKPSDQCSSSSGQVYLRVGTHKGMIAMMYAWFFPKDEEREPHHILSLYELTSEAGNWYIFRGGRSSVWAHVIVWVEIGNPDAREAAMVTVSCAGKWTSSKDWTGPGRRPMIHKVYEGTSFTPGKHQEQPREVESPLVLWSDLPPAAQKALNEYDFDDLNAGQFEPDHIADISRCPINNRNFEDYLQRAFTFRSQFCHYT